jgi:hypothetical protein
MKGISATQILLSKIPIDLTGRKTVGYKISIVVKMMTSKYNHQMKK